MLTASPIIRPRKVFVVFDDHIPRPGHRVSAVTRSPGVTVVHLQALAAHDQVSAEVNRVLDDDEYLGWVTPYLRDTPLLIARFRASPTLDNLPGRVLATPMLPNYIPVELQAPGVNYN